MTLEKDSSSQVRGKAPGASGPVLEFDARHLLCAIGKQAFLCTKGQCLCRQDHQP